MRAELRGGGASICWVTMEMSIRIRTSAGAGARTRTKKFVEGRTVIDVYNTQMMVLYGKCSMHRRM